MNLNIILSGGTQITTAPAVGKNDIAYFSASSFAIISGVFTFTYAPVLTANQVAIIRSSTILSAGRTYNSAYKSFTTLNSTSTSPADVTADWTSIFGTAPVAGDIVFMKVRIVDKTTGFESLNQTYRVLCS